MKTKIDGIEHFKKLMNISIPKDIVEVDESYLNNVNFYRDWFNNVALIKRKYTDEIIAYQFEDGKLFARKENLNVN